MRNLLIILGVVCSVCLLNANTQIDSLEVYLTTANQIEKVVVLNELSQAYQEVSARRSITYAQSALQLSQESGNKEEIAKYNIQVNVVAPNALTGMTKGVFSDKVAKRIKPEFNTPIVTFLCSEENRESGMIFTMSAGWYARSAMVSGKGVCIGDANRVITAEEVMDNFDQIKSIENALPYEDCSQIYTLGKSLTGR